ncbi:hypothetical protein KIW84_014600 [Lathyrus oleraceus]|uniref:Uncharacterized protein n=1 Tax=Pisum sativum TaxID=3888 RepID=A0A9D5GZM9_PEA|nr:hypothetical protein KIW84_014600 [Pisum sativum]
MLGKDSRSFLENVPTMAYQYVFNLRLFTKGLMPSSRNMLDVSSGGALLSKSYEDGYKLIESIISNTYQWLVTKATTKSNQKRPTGVHEVIETITLATQVAQIHQMMKNMMTSKVTKFEPVKVVTDASEVACVCCGDAHLFEECSTNPVYVRNNKVALINGDNSIELITHFYDRSDIRVYGACPVEVNTIDTHTTLSFERFLTSVA